MAHDIDHRSGTVLDLHQLPHIISFNFKRNLLSIYPVVSFGNVYKHARFTSFAKIYYPGILT